MSRTDSLAGFKVTLSTMLKKPEVIGYPERKTPVFPRFRGRHRLWTHENGLEKCVGCSLCVAACPADCIRVVAEENDPKERVSSGERFARIYEINMLRCIFCGYCELACPFDAITMVPVTTNAIGMAAHVNPVRCVSCGVCSASCAPMAVICSGASMSAGSKATLVPCFFTVSIGTLLSFSEPRPFMTMCAPASAIAVAMPSPMPDVDPVMMATLPASDMR